MNGEILYHYTTAAGLLGILEPVDVPLGWQPQINSSIGSFSLWATDTSYLNDSGELQYGASNLARELRRGVAPEDELDGLVLELTASLTGAFPEFDPLEISDDLYGPDRLSVYVTCFCEDGDLLSQWRSYGTDRGYSIGFKAEALRQMVRVAGRWSDSDTTRMLKKPDLAQVQYGDELPILREVAEEILASGTDSREAWQMCLQALAQVKSQGFASEHEWRLFDLDRHNYTRCEYRIGPLGVTPYTRLTYFDTGGGINPIDRVYVSPGPDLSQRVRAAHQILRQRGFRDVDVVPSGISYRG